MEDPRTRKDYPMETTLVWDFQILPGPAGYLVKPVKHQFVQGCERDEALPPLDIDVKTVCNCSKQPKDPVCLVNLPSHRINYDDGLENRDEHETSDSGTGSEVGEINQLIDVHNLTLPETDHAIINDESAEFAETFVVVGSWADIHYQQALCMCSFRRSQNLGVEIKLIHEPTNIKDRNAIRFDIFHNDKWYTIGYCGITKLPKLTRAMWNDQIVSTTLSSLKRAWSGLDKKFLFHAAVPIVKIGKWDKDERNNKYNSTITFDNTL